MTAPEPHDWRPRPPTLQRVLRAVSTPVLLGAAVFVIVVVIAIVVVMIRSQGAAIEALPAVSDGTSAETRTPAPAPTPALSDEPEQVFVHVVGEVREPGVVTLPPGARVEAAISAAGGATSAAVLSGVNLARPVTDGEQIVVPDEAAATAASAGGGGAGEGGGGVDASTDGLVNINAADSGVLQTLPGIGPALADRIIEWRAANGAFTSVEQLTDVSGIGPKTLDRFRDRVRV